jgi:V/A-type H+/Na+-transporting ATPase subunit C
MTYSAINTKARALYGKLLKKDDYEELILKKSVNEIASYLKNSTHYSSVLKDVNENTVHRSELEVIIRKDIMNDYHKFLRFTSGNARKFLQGTYKKHETESLKALFRALETGGDPGLFADSLLFLKDNTTVNFENLLKSQTSQEFIKNLEGTEYYNVLKPFVTDNIPVSLFNIEMLLDLNYFKFLHKRIAKYVRGKDTQPLEKEFGIKTDVLNILWIYRCKKYYSMKKEIIYSYILPFNYYITRNTLNSMVEAQDMEAFMDLVSKTRYKKIFERDIDQFYELNFAQYMYETHRGFFRKYALTLSSPVDYLHMKEYELSNIVSIIEGIRYGLMPEKIRKFIVSYGF